MSHWMCRLGMLGLLFLLGCSESETTRKGQLMVVLTTDLQPPKDFDSVRLEVLVFGSLVFGNDYVVGQSALSLPASIGLVAGEEPGRPVTIRLMASRRDEVRMLREVVTTVPEDRIARLTIPVEWLCLDQVKTVDDEVVSSCGEGETCLGGECVSTRIESDSLPDYAPPEVFGGGEDANTGSCFDTVECFSHGYAVDLDLDSCSIPAVTAAADEEGVSLAMVAPPESDGICGPDACLVPLDADGAAGYGESSGRWTLPDKICDSVEAGDLWGIAVTTACPTKTVSLPTCGDWSSIKGEPGTFDGAAPQGVDFAGAAGEDQGGTAGEAEGGSSGFAGVMVGGTAPVGGTTGGGGTVGAGGSSGIGGAVVGGGGGTTAGGGTGGTGGASVEAGAGGEAQGGTSAEGGTTQAGSAGDAVHGGAGGSELGTGGLLTGGAGTGGLGMAGADTAGAGTAGTGAVDCDRAMPTSAGQTHSMTSGTGRAGDLTWQIWSTGSPGTLTTYAGDTAFNASWNNSGDFLARMGMEWGINGKNYTDYGMITADYVWNKTGDAGDFSLLGVNGWSSDPCVEWYIIEDSFHQMPYNPGEQPVGTVNIDGGTYNLVSSHIVGTGGDQCGGATEWDRFYSIRLEGKRCGTIDLTKHFDAWAAQGWTLGNLVDAKIMVEVAGGEGSVDFPVASVKTTE